ncbi:hypothetical protein COE81_19770 [Bacillus wiedmannii]|nr:SDR family oxidoreductase [Bacillus wiedmannii]PHB04910.1 hypothetical protein COE81_19770 [Bacillus wiedmannii]
MEGELSLIHLGLDSKKVDYIKNNGESIIHCGGEVSHYGERGNFQKVNVQSTKYLLELAKNTKHEVKVFGRGSTGRTTASTLEEQLAMKEVKSNPQGIVLTRIPMTDPRWPREDGWVKMVHNVNGVEIHYVKNTRTGEFDDFKFKN